MELIEPNKYEGYCKHPTEDETKKQVVSATILPNKHSVTGWVDLIIYFSDGKRFYVSSQSVKGAKQRFAFQCQKGSKWSFG